jgi:phosphomevalonate kinase
VTRTIHAPGKLMIAGEYAVLDGAPALVLAVDRGVKCTVSASDTLEITTPDGDDRFVRPVLARTTGSYTFSHWNPTDLPDKPGFGGSAAACVAACVAAGRPATHATKLHRDIQGGGSGADVAASIHGGMIRFQAGQATDVPPIQPVVIWSGKSASTQPLVDQYLSWKERADFIRESTAIVESFHEDPVARLHENALLLQHMAVVSGLPYATPRLAAIASTAVRLGGAAKPSGAGGGDCAVALFPDPDAEQAFRDACTQRGWTLIEVQVASGAEASG